MSERIDTTTLRNKILNLAFSGKLVKQDPNDEPASILLERIKKEKETLVKEGKIKKSNQESIIFKGDDNHYYEKIGNNIIDITDEIPFKIPNKWACTKLMPICSIISTTEHQIEERNILDCGLIPVVSQGKSLIDGYTNETNKRIIVNEPIVLFGDHTRVVKYINFDFVVGADGTKLLQPILANPRWFYYTLLWVSYNIRDKGYGRHFDLIKKEIIPLPPLAEQERIVNKIEELFSEIDKIEKAQDELDKIKEMARTKVLDLAVRGKLVKQDPNDEPASVLLEKIKQEKEKLIKEGKIKRDKNESIIYKGDDKNYYEKIGSSITNITNEIPFDIPDNWCWIRFDNLVNFCIGKTPARDNKDYWSKFMPWVSISDMKNGEIITSTKEQVSEAAVNKYFKSIICEPGTLIMSFKLSIGKTSLVSMKCTHNEAIISIYPYYDINDTIKNYLFHFIGFLSNYSKTVNAVKGKTLNSKTIGLILIPLPSIKKQNEIITRIKSVLSII